MFDRNINTLEMFCTSKLKQLPIQAKSKHTFGELTWHVE